MIKELNSQQVVMVSGGSSDADVSGAATSSLLGGIAGFFTDKAVVSAAARIGVSAARGAAFGGVAGVAVGVAIGVGYEIWSSNQD